MKRIIVAFLFCCFSLTLYSQTEVVPLPKGLQNYSVRNLKDSTNRKCKFLFGGNLGLQFGSVTSIQLNPKVGILPNQYICLGISGLYQYIRYQYDNIVFRKNIFGVGVFGEGYLFRQMLVLHAEYEFLSFPTNTEKRLLSHAILVGPGLNQKITSMVSFYAVILFPAYVTLRNVYSIPIVRVGVNVKL